MVQADTLQDIVIMTASAAMTVNGKAVCTGDLAHSAADMLLCHDKGPYTTARYSEGRVEALDCHFTRLAEALMELQLNDQSSFETLPSSELTKREDQLLELTQMLRGRLQRDLDAATAYITASGFTTAAVTILLTRTLNVLKVPPELRSGIEDINTVVHTSACAKPMASQKGVEVRVVGLPRKQPTIKHSQWVVDRQALKQHLAPTTAEGLLCTDDGYLLEGMITNFFVVTDDGNGGSCVVTAPIDAGVLGGVMRRGVLQACAALGIQVKEEAPHWSTHRSWQEAFLTNSLRPLQPVKRIQSFVPGLCGGIPWEISLPGPVGLSITDKLRIQTLSELASG